MRSVFKPLALLAIACAVSPAWAINKCTQPDGSVAFQDAPCVGKGRGEILTVKPASGPARPLATNEESADSATGKKPMSEAQRIEANVASSQKERRLRDLEQRLVPRADRSVQAHLQACADEQERLERSKGMYVQNLYGKTDAAQKAAEQAAAASRCDTKDRALRASAAELHLECVQLGGCKQ